jgi:hypothetical protein
MLVLLVDASIKSRSQAPLRQLTGQAWITDVLPLVDQSNVSARDLQGFRDDSAALGATTAQSDLTTMADSTRDTYQAYEKLTPPSSLEGEAGLLETCLLERSEATASLVAAVRHQLASPASAPTTAQAQRISAAISNLQVADSAYGLFARRLPRSIGEVPASKWVTQASQYVPATLEVWLAALRSRISLAPLHLVKIVALTTTPGPIGASGKTETLSPSSRLQVTVVVGNVGNQLETDLSVRVALSKSSGTASASDVISALSAGSDWTLQLGPLAPKIGATTNLIVTVTPPPGSTTKAITTTLVFTMPSPTSSTTTTVPLKTKTSSPTTTTPTQTTPPQTTPTTSAQTTPTTSPQTAPPTTPQTAPPTTPQTTPPTTTPTTPSTT